MLELFSVYVFSLGTVLSFIYIIVVNVEDKWDNLSDANKSFILKYSYISIFINKECLKVSKEVFNDVISYKQSYKFDYYFILKLLSLIGALYILKDIIDDYFIIKKIKDR